jgi:hypothetical protein
MKNLFFAIGAIVVIIALSWFGILMMNPSSPSQVFAQMQEEMERVDSFKFEGVLNVDGTFVSDSLPSSGLLGQFSGEKSEDEAKPVSGNLNIDMTGVVQKTGENTYVSQSDISFSYDSEQGNGQAELSLISQDKMAYLKLNTASISTTPDAQAVVDSLLASGQNKWVAFEAPVSAEQDEEAMTRDSQKLQQELKELFENLDEAVDAEVLGDEEIRGVNTTKVGFKIDRQKTFDAIVAENNRQEGRDMTEEEKTELRTDLETVANLEYVIWIGKSDHLPHKIQVSGPVSNEVEQYSGNLNLSIEFFDFNTPNEVIAPEGAIDFEQLMGMMLGSMMGGIDLNAMMQVDTQGSTEQVLQMPTLDPSQVDIEALQKLYAEQGIEMNIPQ